MRKNLIKKGSLAVAITVAAILSFSGCSPASKEGGPINKPGTEEAGNASGDTYGAENAEGETAGDENTGESNTGNDNSENGAGGENGESITNGEYAGTGEIRVNTTEDFLNAIAPNAHIIIEPGYYNMTDYLSGYSTNESRNNWNNAHEYVKIRDEFDGVEVVIQKASGLIIEGGSDNYSDTEIVIDPRYSAILYFIGSEDISISNVTMGHTDRGNCIGDVLDFEYCKNITIGNVDLYGCGVYGIGCDTETSNLHVTDSMIRDCEYGPFNIRNPHGDFIFDNCTFTGSDGGGYFEANGNSNLIFNNCEFGIEEANVWYFDENAEKNNCVFATPTEYPEYGYDN
ncbi:MAG: hypothetical protein K5669_11720 [Lachnospiraceae bacterium]|nr:hypothetical protein [Lachnospiraceae bacterium]